MFPDDNIRRFIADLAPWDDGTVDPSEEARVRRFEALMCSAGVELARGMIAEAANVGSVPDRVKPYMRELAPLVAELKKAVAAGTFDESTFHLAEAIWGS